MRKEFVYVLKEGDTRFSYLHEDGYGLTTLVWAKKFILRREAQRALFQNHFCKSRKFKIVKIKIEEVNNGKFH